jgi:hypothetical protein
MALIDYYLKDIANGIERRNFPKGVDRRALTRAIEFVLDSPAWAWVKLGQLEWFAERMNLDIISPPLPVEKPRTNPDMEAYGRLEPELKEYRAMCKQERVDLKAAQALLPTFSMPT